MCAVAFFLLQQGKRAIYLLEANEFICQGVPYIVHGLRLAFADDDTTLDQIAMCETKEDIERLADRLAQAEVRMYFVLDQANAFDDESGVSRSQKRKCRDALDWMDHIAGEHFLILSASGSYKKAVKARLTTENVVKMNFFGGLDDHEMKCWWDTNIAVVPCLQSPMLHDQFRKVVEYRSGRNPLLLHGIVESLATIKSEDIQTQSDLEVTTWARISQNQYWKQVEDQVHKFITDAKMRGRTSYGGV